MKMFRMHMNFILQEHFAKKLNTPTIFQPFRCSFKQILTADVDVKMFLPVAAAVLSAAV